jgi:hypothetical protein
MPPSNAPREISESRLVTSPYFHLERFHLHPGAEHRLQGGGPSVLIVTNGTLDIASRVHSQGVRAARGEVVLIPAALTNPVINSPSSCSWLEVTFPK